MIENAQILLVDDDVGILFSLEVFLRECGAKTTQTSDPGKIPALLEAESFDAVLLDMNYTRNAISGEEGLHWLRRIREIDPDLPVIAITAFADIPLAISAIREGAFDFITKPWQNEKLMATLHAAVKARSQHRESALLMEQRDVIGRQEGRDFREIIGQSPVIRSVFSTIRKIAPTGADVLITGENGTGKELVARAIHRLSERAKGIFVSVDMGLVNHQLFDSELFGHLRGAFTGANANRIGKIQAADKGTLFLDEIGNLPPELQAKLLSVLETRTVCPLGTNKGETVDIRLVSATNANLYEMVETGGFRMDLLYRINTIEIHLPPLRSRPEDIPLLADHFLGVYKTKYGKSVAGFNPKAMKRLQEYDFPGNVRELRHLVHRAVILCPREEIGIDEIALKPRTGTTQLRLDSLNIEKAEEKLIATAIERFGGNMSKAAKALGINRTSLYRRVGKYGI